MYDLDLKFGGIVDPITSEIMNHFTLPCPWPFIGLYENIHFQLPSFLVILPVCIFKHILSSRRTGFLRLPSDTILVWLATKINPDNILKNRHLRTPQTAGFQYSKPGHLGHHHC